MTGEPALVAPHLRRHLPDAAGFAPIGAGMFATAYGFTAGGRDYVLRVNAFVEDFDKDDYAAAHFASAALPIPRMVARGRLEDGRYYAVTERCPGLTMTTRDSPVERAILPSLFACLESLHEIDVTPHFGWGLTDGAFNGRFLSWENYLRRHYNQKFDYDWPALFAGGILEERLFRELREEMIGRLPYTRGYRAIVHGDFGFDNVVHMDGHVTGVLDWAEGRIGDPLYDVAYLDFYSRIPAGDLWREWAGREIPHFEERMTCYLLYIGLGSLVIAAHLGDERDYGRTRQRTLSVFAPGRRRADDWPED